MPYSISMRILSKIKKIETEKSLRERIKMSKTVLERKVNDRVVDIKVYVLKHESGIAMLFDN